MAANLTTLATSVSCTNMANTIYIRDIDEQAHKRYKVAAIEHGVTLREFVLMALEDKMCATITPKPTRVIKRAIRASAPIVDPEAWDDEIDTTPAYLPQDNPPTTSLADHKPRICTVHGCPQCRIMGWKDEKRGIV